MKALPYYELGSETPDYTCSSFESIQRAVAETMLRDERITLSDMARVDLVELFHPNDDVLSVEAVTWDGRIVGTWGDQPERPISEYFRCHLDAARAWEAMEATR